MAQFGKMPNEGKRQKLNIKVHELEAALTHAKKELAHEQWLMETYNGAIKGWEARGLK